MPWIELLYEPRPVRAPTGVVYSTAPRTGEATDGARYFLKGPDFGRVFAEALAYQLAGRIGLPVPAWAFWRSPLDGLTYFASREISVRSGLLELLRDGVAVERDHIGRCIAFDVWVVNTDRNTGNLLPRPVLMQRVTRLELVAIDFERALALSGPNRFAIPAIHARDLWPSEELGRMCRGCAIPEEAVQIIGGLDHLAILGAVEAVMDEWGNPPEVDWTPTAIQVLTHRASHIRQLVQEVWSAT